MWGWQAESSRESDVPTHDRGGGGGTKWIKERAKVYTHVLLYYTCIYSFRGQMWTTLSLHLPLCLAAICSARARLLPPAGWATAATNSRHEGCPKRFVSYDFFSHSVRTSRRQLLGSRYWASTVLSVSGFSLRANPTSFHLCATLLSSYCTSKRSWMSAKGYEINVHVSKCTFSLSN